MLKLNERLAQHGLFYPDDPASYPCSLVGGRIGTSGWSLIGSRYGHTRDLVLSFDHVLPTGEVMHVGDGIGGKISKTSSGYQLKHLFMGHQGTLGIATRATLKLFPKPEAELSPFWAFDNYDDAYACTGALARAGVATFAGAVLFDEYKVAYLRRDDEAYIPQPTDVRALVCAVDVRLRGRGARRRQAAVPDRQGARRPLPRRRDLRGRLGRAARPLRHAAARPDQGRPGHPDVVALRGRRGQLLERPRGHARPGTRSSPTCAGRPTSSTTGACSPTRRRTPGWTTSPRSTSASGSSGSTTPRGRRGCRRRGTSPPRRSPTAARSAPATAPAARARSTSCPRNSAAAST